MTQTHARRSFLFWVTAPLVSACLLLCVAAADSADEAGRPLTAAEVDALAALSLEDVPLVEETYAVQEQYLRHLMLAALEQDDEPLAAAENLRTEIGLHLRPLPSAAHEEVWQSPRFAAVQRAEARREQLLEAMKRLYESHFDALFEKRLERLLADPQDAAAVSFFCHAQPERVDERMADATPSQRLRVLMLRLLHAPTEELNEDLRSYPGPTILEAAKATYWPVQIEPPRRDGAYHWAVQARALENNVAWGVLEISISQKQAAKASADDRWVHVRTFERWVYLYRFPREYLGSYEGMLLQLSRMALGDITYSRAAAGGTHLTLARAIPQDVQLPVVERDPEQLAHRRALHQWVKPLVPERLRSHLSYEEDPKGNPTITPAAAEPN